MADVEKLRLLCRLTQLGHPIGDLAQLNMQELSRLAGHSDRQLPSSPESPSLVYGAGQTQQDLVNALRVLELDEVDRRLRQARLATPARSFVLEVVVPLMHEVGELVASGKLGISQEHALSAILRNHLGELLAQSRQASTPVRGDGLSLPDLVLSTPEGDLHEFGTLLAAILAAARGFRTHYLGPNIPPGDLAQAAINIGARVVVVGCAEVDARRLVRPLKEYVRLLAKQLAAARPREIEVWIGGRCDFDPQAAKLQVPVFHVASLPVFDSRLDRYVHPGWR
jgi:methylmalonyl-CoA mutase cobalamin-binding subunit